jgi:hypothetical protein
MIHKPIDAEYKTTNLDDVIKTCEKFHVKEQHQLKTLLQKYEHLFDGTLGEFKMEQITISLQLMDPNCKPIHARAYTVPRSVERQLQHSKEIVRLVHIGEGLLEEDYSSEWASRIPSFAISKENGTIRFVTDFRKLNLLLKHAMSPITYSKDRDSCYDTFNGRVYLGFSIGLKYGYYHIKLDHDADS